MNPVRLAICYRVRLVLKSGMRNNLFKNHFEGGLTG